MNDAIRQRARELGFDDCRFAAAVAPASAPQFTQWLAGHRHGEMAYLERNAHKRVEPQLVLAGAKSIISLAVSYADEDAQRETPSPQPSPPVGARESESSGLSQKSQATARLPSPPSGEKVPAGRMRGQSDVSKQSTHPRPPTPSPRPSPPVGARESESAGGVIARYARFEDYHDIIGEKLKSLTEFINQLGGEATRSLWYVDTGPLLERDIAQRAGLGFIGKHTNVISRRLGNWIFLAEIITTLELAPDAPEKNRCGSCTRCIAACPTEAITAPFELDARRCISYLTIELKGSIPIELRPAIGNRIYGCDDCLAACPWNRFAQSGKIMREHARADLSAPDLIELLSLDEDEFKKRFQGTPILRTERRGLLRNVCVALGNVGDASALPALERASQGAEPLIAEHARWAMEEIQKRSSVVDK